MRATEQRWDVKRDALRFPGLRFGSIKSMVLKGAIKEDDLVWHAGMSGWRKAGEQEELKSFFKENKKTNKELACHKILVVDDESDMLELMMMVLTRKGYQAFGAKSGPAGILLNEQEHPDLIILDLRMLEMDGIETLRHIRKMDAKVRVIILSGLPDGADSPATIKEMADLDVSERLCKQLDNDQVLHAVRDVLGR